MLQQIIVRQKSKDRNSRSFSHMLTYISYTHKHTHHAYKFSRILVCMRIHHTSAHSHSYLIIYKSDQ